MPPFPSPPHCGLAIADGGLWRKSRPRANPQSKIRNPHSCFHSRHIPPNRAERDQDHQPPHGAGCRQQQHRGPQAEAVGQVPDERRGDRIAGEVGEQHVRTEHRCPNRRRHHVQDHGGQRPVVPRVEEERPEQERDEEPELVDQEQRGADRPTEHESRAGHDDPSSAPPREQPVPRPTAEQRAQRAAREPPDAELPSYGGDRRPWVRSKKLGAQAIRPVTAKVTSAPPTNIQISVGVRSTVPAAWRKSPKAVAATSVASLVPRTATGTSRSTVHTMPMLTHAANTAVSRPRGSPSNTSSTAESAAPASVSPMSGAPSRSTSWAPTRPRAYQLFTVARIVGGACRRGSRSRDASSARRKPGTPSATNAARQP